MVTLSDSDDIFTGSNAQVAVLDYSIVSVIGDDNMVVSGLGDKITLTGAGDSIQAGYNTQMTISGDAAQADTVSGTTLEVTLAAGLPLILNASEVNVNLGANCLVFATGDNTNFYGANDKIYSSQASYGGDSINGNNNRNIVAAGSLLEVFGDDNYIHLSYKSSVSLVGSGERLAGSGFYAQATGADFWVGGNGVNGAIDAVTASKCTVRIGIDTNLAITGDDDTIAERAGAVLYLDGSGDQAHCAQGSKITITGKGMTAPVDMLTGVRFSVVVAASAHVELSALAANAWIGDDVALLVARSNNQITASPSDTISILSGSSNTVLANQNDVIDDGGTGSVLQFGGPVGATTVNNFGADVGGVIELLNGVGGYATAADAFAALTGDGAGGVKLSLGVYGSIDFAATAASQLSAGSFKIG